MHHQQSLHKKTVNSGTQLHKNKTPKKHQSSITNLFATRKSITTKQNILLPSNRYFFFSLKNQFPLEHDMNLLTQMVKFESSHSRVFQLNFNPDVSSVLMGRSK